MEDAIGAGLLIFLPGFCPEGGEPPIEYINLKAEIDAQIPGEQVGHIRIAAVAVEQHQLLKAVLCDAAGDIVQQGIGGLGGESQRAAEIHVLVALADVQLRREDDVAAGIAICRLDGFIHQRAQDDGIRAHRKMRAVLLCGRHGQQDDGVILIQRGELVSGKILPFCNHG